MKPLLALGNLVSFTRRLKEPILIVELDEKGLPFKLCDSNLSFCLRYGYSLEELLALPLKEHIIPESWAGLVSVVETEKSFNQKTTTVCFKDKWGQLQSESVYAVDLQFPGRKLILVIFDCIEETNSSSYNIAFSNGDTVSIVDIRDIIYITRVARKSIVHTKDRVLVTKEPLRVLEDSLKNKGFFRCHKGFIINPNMVREITPSGRKTYSVKMYFTEEEVLMTAEKQKEFINEYCLTLFRG